MKQQGMIDTHLPQTYYYGAFFGGKKQQVIDFCEIMIKYQQADNVIHHEPIWNDESYLNKHFHFNPPSRIVPSDKFMFDVSDKGGINNMRNTKSDIQTQLKSIASKPYNLFEIYNNKIVFLESIQTDVLYGKYIGKYIPVEAVKNLNNGEKVYMAKHDSYVKMVSGSGQARYYRGEISDFRSNAWESYADVGHNYLLRLSNNSLSQ